jgi:ABC-type polysaccharide/polyol phosphate transport system ATPase subunit
MSSGRADLAVHVRNLSKRFDIYARPLDMLREVLTGRPRHSEFWALRSVSMDVHRGEVVGIVGRNGAGKSTLLKILTGTLDKTAGDVVVHGRISSILELGTGFHPEYTGRDNIRMGGLCLGMSKAEIAGRMDWIIDFSELEAVIDRPLKTYSTGMQARLAFSTAVSTDPDVLIVDEALSVGDAKFQRKCFGKFEEFRSSGKAILFVSHNTATIDNFCDRAIYLRDGEVRAEGKPSAVTGLYIKELVSSADHTTDSSASQSSAQAPPAGSSSEQHYGNGGATIIDYGLVDAAGRRVARIASGEKCSLIFRVRCNRERIEGLNVGVDIHTIDGVRLFALNPVMLKMGMPDLRRGDVLDVRVDLDMRLAPGEFFVTAGAWSLEEISHLDRIVDALHFTVEGDSALSACLVNLSPLYHVSVQRSGVEALMLS